MSTASTIADGRASDRYSAFLCFLLPRGTRLDCWTMSNPGWAAVSRQAFWGRSCVWVCLCSGVVVACSLVEVAARKQKTASTFWYVGFPWRYSGKCLLINMWRCAALWTATVVVGHSACSTAQFTLIALFNSSSSCLCPRQPLFRFHRVKEKKPFWYCSLSFFLFLFFKLNIVSFFPCFFLFSFIHFNGVLIFFPFLFSVCLALVSSCDLFLFSLSSFSCYVVLFIYRAILLQRCLYESEFQFENYERVNQHWRYPTISIGQASVAVMAYLSENR